MEGRAEVSDAPPRVVRRLRVAFPRTSQGVRSGFRHPARPLLVTDRVRVPPAPRRPPQDVAWYQLCFRGNAWGVRRPAPRSRQDASQSIHHVSAETSGGWWCSVFRRPAKGGTHRSPSAVRRLHTTFPRKRRSGGVGRAESGTGCRPGAAGGHSLAAAPALTAEGVTVALTVVSVAPARVRPNRRESAQPRGGAALQGVAPDFRTGRTRCPTLDDVPLDVRERVT